MTTNQEQELSMTEKLIRGATIELSAPCGDEPVDMVGRIARLEWWLERMIALATPAAPPVSWPSASCGHPANEDGECNCSSWPERAPYPPTPADH